MKSVYNFVVTPIGKRYNNSKKVGESNLILNTEIYNHQYINRKAKVLSVPIVGSTDIKVGDTVIVHHNVFRRWHNVLGQEKNSKSYFDEKTYLVNSDQIYLYKRRDKWQTQKGYCFVKPIKSKNKLSVEVEQPLVGIVQYADGEFKKGDVVGFRPSSEYEFIVDGQKLYRILSNFITIKYGHQKNEEEYNPSWA